MSGGCWSALNVEFSFAGEVAWDEATNACASLGTGYILAEFTDSEDKYLAMKADQGMLYVD